MPQPCSIPHCASSASQVWRTSLRRRLSRLSCDDGNAEPGSFILSPPANRSGRPRPVTLSPSPLTTREGDALAASTRLRLRALDPRVDNAAMMPHAQLTDGYGTLRLPLCPGDELPIPVRGLNHRLRVAALPLENRRSQLTPELTPDDLESAPGSSAAPASPGCPWDDSFSEPTTCRAVAPLRSGLRQWRDVMASCLLGVPGVVAGGAARGWTPRSRSWSDRRSETCR